MCLQQEAARLRRKRAVIDARRPHAVGRTFELLAALALRVAAADQIALHQEHLFPVLVHERHGRIGAGLDAQEMQSALVDRVYAERALAAVIQAHDLGITNTPTIFIGKARINGWTYDEVLEQVLEQQGFTPKAALAGTA